jgi:hypothetical protein
VREIRAVDIVLLVDYEMAHKTPVRDLSDGDQTVAIANLGKWGGGGGGG